MKEDLTCVDDGMSSIYLSCQCDFLATESTGYWCAVVRCGTLQSDRTFKLVVCCWQKKKKLITTGAVPVAACTVIVQIPHPPLSLKWMLFSLMQFLCLTIVLLTFMNKSRKVGICTVLPKSVCMTPFWLAKHLNVHMDVYVCSGCENVLEFIHGGCCILLIWEAGGRPCS